MELINKFLNGDKRSCARLITLVENDDKEAAQVIKEIHKHTGNAHIIGITGPPGGGKSTLTDKLTKELLNRGKKIGIIAIDPTSPFSGGSLLGDRIRMQDLATNPNVFIRSMGARGHLGGLSKATHSVVKLLDAFGCDYIFIETVGVGQSEIDIVKTADTIVMVMVPGLGDDIQAIKAGVMEIADIYAVNKCDLDGVNKTVNNINMMLDLNKEMDRRPPVIKVSGTKIENINSLTNEIINHMEYMIKTDTLNKRRENNTKLEILKLVQEKIIDAILNQSNEDNMLDSVTERIMKKEVDTYSARDEILKSLQF